MSETITIYCKKTILTKKFPIGSSLLDIYSLVGAPLRLRPMNAQVNNKNGRAYLPLLASERC